MKLNRKELLIDLGEYFHLGEIGLEKESLRCEGHSLSSSIHPEVLGSALCNSFITTDFSEVQPEFITPPFKNSYEALDFLFDIHHFFHHKVAHDNLWPMSMPPYIGNRKIPIAYYGNSGKGIFKHVYRQGLSKRYGRLMQTISGVHFNYSLPNVIWQKSLFEDSNQNSVRSRIYLSMLRNLLRMNWLVLYLFGCSPSITSDFINVSNHEFESLDEQTFFLPYATSLRMSDFGYQNLSRKKLTVSPNSIYSYTRDLLKATEKKSGQFATLEDGNEGYLSQINSNILQIEDEYYASVRAKSSNISEDRFVKKILSGGIDFIELRSVDLDPFSIVGIREDTMIFLEVLMVYAFLLNDTPMSIKEHDDLLINDINVSKYGRHPDLTLIKNGNRVLLKDWANQIIDEMMPIAEILDKSNKVNYSESLNLMRKRIKYPEETPSAMFLDQLKEIGSHIELGHSIAERNKSEFLSIDRVNNRHWDLLEDESKKSCERQRKIESDGPDFDQYKEKYFSSN